MRWQSRMVVLILICAVVGWSALAYVGQFQLSRKWLDKADVPRESASAENLFRAAHAAELVTMDSATFAVQVEPCEALYKPDIAGNPQRAVDARPTLQRLCESGAGRQVLDELANWNASLQFVALRDSRQDRPVCATNKPIDGPVISRRCKPTEWQVDRVIGPGDAAPFPPLPGAEPPLQDYAHAASANVPFMSDWLMAGVPFGENPTLRLSTVVEPRRTQWFVDVIGEPRKISVGAQEFAVAADRLRQEFVAQGLRLSVSTLCNEREVIRQCVEARDDQVPFTTRIAVTGTIDKPTRIAIEGGAARVLPRSIRRVLDFRNATGEARLRRSPHLSAKCELSVSSIKCALDWTALAAVENFGSTQYRILLGDRKTEAVDEKGRIRPEAVRLGLAPIVGFDPQDVGSLTSGLAQQKNKGDVDFLLTIDPAIQSLAAEIVNSEMRRRTARRRPNLPQGPQARMAVVVMDASSTKTAGEILAMASWPTFAPHQHIWDINALAAGNERDFPLAGHAWRATDVHAMPGSTFKIVTAIAGIDAAMRGEANVADLLTGRLSAANSARLLGVDLRNNVLPVPTLGRTLFYVHNASDAAYETASLAPSATRCAPATGPFSRQLGVCEAMLKSSNLWFAGTALLLDRAKLMRGGVEHGEIADNLMLANAARRLFWVADPKEEEERKKKGQPRQSFDLMGGTVAGATRLRAAPIRLPVMEPKIPASAMTPEQPRARRLDLALNGYGQGVDASTLAMASVYASVAAGRTIRPRLVQADMKDLVRAAGDGEPLFSPTAANRALLSAYVDNVHRGLSGVVNARGGTAYAYFQSVRPLASRVYAKTGTAITIGDFYSAWLAGWVLPQTQEGRTLAFACWLTHTRQYGGSACGPVIKRLLEGIR